MAHNPFDPPLSDLDDDVSHRHASRMGMFMYWVFVPTAVAFLVYVPFRLVAWQINNATWDRTDNFYYPYATATWPLYSGIVATLVSVLCHRARIAWAWRLIAMLAGVTALILTGLLDVLLGFSDMGRNGLFMWSDNVPGISTPKLSAMLVLPAYLLSWIFAARVRRRRKFDTDSR